VSDGSPCSLSRVIVFDGVLSRAECDHLTLRAERESGFAASTHQGVPNAGFRRGRRAVLTDGGLAAEVFARIERHLPRALRDQPPQNPRANGSVAVGGEATATGWGGAAGIWEQLRVLSYDEGDFFLRHRDNACQVGHSSLLPNCRSFCSILLYLADSGDGSGATRFYCDPIPLASRPSTTAEDEPEQRQHSHADTADSDGGRQGSDECPARSGTDEGDDEGSRESSREPPADSIICDVVPWAGRAVVFPHDIMHESMPVRSGRKYVMRGDMLYQPQTPARATPG
jgi:hypothetical protein